MRADAEDAGVALAFSEQSDLPLHERISGSNERVQGSRDQNILPEKPHLIRPALLVREGSPVDLPGEWHTGDLRDGRDEVDRLRVAVHNLSLALSRSLHEHEGESNVGEVRRGFALDAPSQLARPDGDAVIGDEDDKRSVVLSEAAQLSREPTDEGVHALRLKEESLVRLADQPLVLLPADVSAREPRRVFSGVRETRSTGTTGTAATARGAGGGGGSSARVAHRCRTRRGRWPTCRALALSLPGASSSDRKSPQPVVTFGRRRS